MLRRFLRTRTSRRGVTLGYRFIGGSPEELGRVFQG